MRLRLAAALVALPLLAVPGSAHAAPIATCNVHVTASATTFTVAASGSTTNVAEEVFFNIWRLDLTGVRDDGTSISYTETAYTRTFSRSYYVSFDGRATGHVHAELNLVGAPRDLACHAAQDAAWSPAGVFILPA